MSNPFPRLTSRFRPAVVRRAMRGLFGPVVAHIDDVPDDLRPAHHQRLSATAGRPRLGSVFSLVSYNVKRAERMGEVALTLAGIMRSLEPDLLLLQEAPPELLDHPDLAGLVTDRALFFAPFHQVARPDASYPFPAYGQVIVSSVPMMHPEVVELPTVNPASLGPGHTLKRIALVTDIPCGDIRRLTITNVHLEPFSRPRARRPQYSAMIEALAHRCADASLLAGDFNPTLSQRFEPGQRDLLTEGFENAFPKRWRPLDTCFVRGHRNILEACRLEQQGSDHRPVFVRICI